MSDERNARSQTQPIEDLLDISRILRGNLTLNVAPVNVTATLHGAIDTMRLAAEAKSIQFDCYLDPTVGSVLGDASRLQQVVWNLLSNAVKFYSHLRSHLYFSPATRSLCCDRGSRYGDRH